MVAELTGVRKDYAVGPARVTALRDVDFPVQHGAFIAVTGPSGSGKSTLLHLLGCLERPTAGDVRFAGRSVSALDDRELSRVRNRAIGFVFQAFHLIPRLSVLENVELPLLYSGLSLAAMRERAVRAVDAVGLGHRGSHAPSELSGGERQRAAIARALVNEPALLLADEPTGNLDAATGADVMRILEERNGAGTAVVVVTHNPEVAARAHRIVHLDGGNVVP